MIRQKRRIHVVPAGAHYCIVRGDLKLRKVQPQPEVKVHIDNERQHTCLHLPEEQLSSR